MRFDGVAKDYLKISYAGTDTLTSPPDALDNGQQVFLPQARTAR
jgi:hypothetical protein